MKEFIDKLVGFEENSDGLLIRNTQRIPQDFLDSLKTNRDISKDLLGSEFQRVASVPTAVLEIWNKQGRDWQNAELREIVSWLKKDGLDAFLATDRSV